MPQPSPKPLPPLATDTAYRATDFESFEYAGSALTGSAAILRLHLKNGTTIDLPASDEQLKFLASVLCEAFRSHVIEHLKKNRWI